uniref:Immediate early response 3-interacting protein 1 n=1 Tax=Athene cunicularia TaxID=194338 RepID=A0A663N920_ATHCN
MLRATPFSAPLIPRWVRAVALDLSLGAHTDRFGWGSDQGIGGFGEEPGIKAQLINLIRSVQTVMRVPLIAVNSVTIILLLLFG